MIRPAALMLLSVAFLLGCGAFQSKGPVDPQPNSYDYLQAQAHDATTRPAPAPDDRTGATQRPPDNRSAEPAPLTGEATTPRKCYELYRQAIKNRDFDACWGLLSGSSKDSYEQAATDLKMRVVNSPNPAAPDTEVLGVLGLTQSDLKDPAQKFNGKMFLSGSMLRQVTRDPESLDEITRTEFDHESIYESKARVYIRMRGQRQTESMNVVREGGAWRIEMRPQRPAN